MDAAAQIPLQALASLTMETLALLGQDPAQCSIVLTTVTDVVGFLSFLGIATLFATMI